jgi:hypothetical protein
MDMSGSFINVELKISDLKELLFVVATCGWTANTNIRPKSDGLVIISYHSDVMVDLTAI